MDGWDLNGLVQDWIERLDGAILFLFTFEIVLKVWDNMTHRIATECNIICLSQLAVPPRRGDNDCATCLTLGRTHADARTHSCTRTNTHAHTHTDARTHLRCRCSTRAQ